MRIKFETNSKILIVDIELTEYKAGNVLLNLVIFDKMLLALARFDGKIRFSTNVKVYYGY